MEFYNEKKEEVIKELDSSLEGLSEREAKIRLAKYGENRLKEVYKLSIIKILLSQFKSFLIYVLIVGMAISFIIQHYIDAFVLISIILLNVGIGFFQQYKAEQSIVKLKQLFIPKAKVIRNGKRIEIPSSELVPGDIVFYEEGDKILADCRIIESENLEANEAVLTGESNPVEKRDVLITESHILAERQNMLYAGTIISKGKSKSIVVFTGMQTEFGRIALKLQEIRLQETPMQKKLDNFAKQITIIAIIIAVFAFILGTLRGNNTVDMLLTAIAICVAAIPQSLPALITVSLALATNRMLKNNVLIRRLSAAETLGSVTVICTDKTGTLTEEKMKVVEVYCNNKFYKNESKGLCSNKKCINVNEDKEIFQLIKTSILSSNARFEEQEDASYKIIGDTTETPLIALALDLNIDKKEFTELEPRIQEISFSSERKMMSILRKSVRRNILYCKGSSSAILDKCSFEYKNDGIFSLNKEKKKELKKIAEDFEKKGLRVLAFAYKYSSGEKTPEDGLIFQGFMALADPPRKEIESAIKSALSAGIKIKMITGDSLLTAKTIGEQIGIKGEVIGGRELEQMGDIELERRIDNIAIFARISPNQKLRIAETLMRKGEEIAITGDGVNDILALKRAHIGVAMGKRGSDVAREVSDMILLDDNFLSIVKGVEEGRVTYDNTKKATKFLLASNVGELLIIFYSILLNLPLPILPLQVLWVNLISDTIPSIALIREPGENVMASKPRKEKSILSGMIPFVILTSIISLLVLALVFHFGLKHFDLAKTRTLVMLSMVGFEAFFVFACRSDKPLNEVGFFSNKSIIYSILILIIFQVAVVYTPLASLFKLTPPSLAEWGIILLASLPGLIVFEIFKILKGKMGKN